LAKAIEEVELVWRQEPFVTGLPKERFEGRPLQVVAASGSEQAREHVLYANLRHDGAGHEKAVEVGLSRLLESEGADRTTMERPDTLRTVFLEQEAQTPGSIRTASCLVPLEPGDQVVVFHWIRHSAT
jgi:hypothetical protein